MDEKILGLDIGVASIGWTLLTKTRNGGFNGIIASGVRIFEPGMELNEATGKAESHAADRRAKRQARRMTVRRRRRLAKVRHILQRERLLPPEDGFGAAVRQLDLDTLERFNRENPADKPAELSQLLPYYLRARALDCPLQRYELGRAVYHLAQRRGFKSNRKSLKPDEDSGAVKKGIGELRRKIEDSGARTLGEWFSRQNTNVEKIRRIWTSRDMYEDEFRRICAARRDLISETLERELYDALFFQRRLQSIARLVGACELEPRRRRCPRANPLALEFRILQDVNHLRVIVPGADVRELSADERRKLLEALECRDLKALNARGELTFTKAKALLGLPKDATFSVEEGGAKNMKANPVTFKMRSILGDRWTAELQERLCSELHAYSSPEGLAKRLRKLFPDDLDEHRIQCLCEYPLPEGYCSLSAVAIRKLLPHMREGKSYSEAIDTAYPDHFKASIAAVASLPPVRYFKPCRNPGVNRALTELRTILNAIVLKYGKPDRIRIELARDLKNNEKSRSEIIKRNREREKMRADIADRIRAEAGIANPSRADIEKVLLAEECHWECPYTGRRICMNSLLREPQFDIEHIIPYSRCLDDSFLNKTLCYHEENRNVKKNCTPYEIYHADAEKYERILNTVRKFNGPESVRQEKLRRFQLQDTALELEDFVSRQLNDTRYASKLAAEYAGLFYGGVVDANGVRRVEAGSGSITALIRGILGLNAILGDGGAKSRDDHRHHAVDAVAIALGGPGIVQQIQNFSGSVTGADLKFKGRQFRRDLTEALVPPDWNDYLRDIGESIDGIIVSHHVRRRVRGPLHQETIYSKGQPGEPQKKKKTVSIDSLNAADLEENSKVIVDHASRRAIKAKLEELGENDPAKAFKKPGNYPAINGIPIRKVKVWLNQETTTVGAAGTDDAREVVTGNNHHAELYDILGPDGNPTGKIEAVVVSLYDAKSRLRKKEPVFLKLTSIDGKTVRYKFSIFNGDIIRTCEDRDQSEGLRVIRSVPQSKQFTYVNICDARQIKDIKASGKFYTALPNTLCQKLRGENGQALGKYTVTVLGELRRDHA